MGIIFLIAYLSGWRKLARHYRTFSSPPYNTAHWKSARIGLGNYNKILSVGTDERGLYLTVFWLFKVGHPPLLIPWSEITMISTVQWIFLSGYRIAIGSPRHTGIVIFSKEIFETNRQYFEDKFV
jgi:hypothetical protein